MRSFVSGASVRPRRVLRAAAGRPLLPGASRGEALARYRDAVWAMQWKYSDMVASAVRRLPPPAAPPFDRPDESLLRGRTVIAGTADEIVENLLELRRQAAVPVDFVARSYLPLLERDAQADLMAQLAEGVAPHL
jgi:hypothetical protein